MITSRGLDKAASVALGGIQKANQKLEKAAADVVQSGISGSEATRVSFSNEALRLAAGAEPVAPETQAGGPPSGTSSGSRAPDLAEALVSSSVAKHEHAANIAVLRTANEMSEDLSEILK